MKPIYPLLSLVLALHVSFAASAATSNTNSDTFRLLNLFGDVFERVRSDYVEEVKDQDLVEAAINGMLTSLDPHSSYLNEKAFEDMRVQTKGEFGGLGIEVTMENGLVKVVSPIDDTPAFKAGVQAGDLISQIDDEQVMGLSLNEAVERLRGPVGSPVRLTLIREGASEPIDLKLNRAVIKIQSVRSRAEKDVGYIRITAFNENTSDGVIKAVQDLKKEIGDNLKGYVLDLRNNPGGLLDQAIAVSDAFLVSGEIVSTRGRTKDSIKRFNANEGDIANNLPMVVLINSGSASAAEIVSGALQDHKRALVMGTRSFGKGSVQTVIPLPDHGAMRLTTSRYYTPSGRSIQAKGIEPDILVEQAKVESVKPAERHEADLRGRLESEDELKKRNGAADKDKGKEADEPEDSSSTDKDADKNGAAKDKNGGEKTIQKGAVKGPTQDPAKDYQLSRALDLIRGISVYQGVRGKE